jgi:hypothetical protein
VSKIVVLSASTAIFAGALGLEQLEVSNAAFVFAALAAVMFASALDARESEGRGGTGRVRTRPAIECRVGPAFHFSRAGCGTGLGLFAFDPGPGSLERHPLWPDYRRGNRIRKGKNPIHHCRYTGS